MSKKILIRADGGFIRGMGHVSKQLTFAKILKELGHKVIFVSQYNEIVKDKIEKENFLVYLIPNYKLYDITYLIEQHKIDLVILDILETTNEFINNLKEIGVKVVSFDNTDISAKECSVTFNIMYQNKILNNQQNVLSGFHYVIMDPQYKNISPKKNFENKILLTQGGSDTSGAMPFLIETLKEIQNEINISVDVVVGSAFSKDNIKAIEETIGMGFTLHYEPKGLKDLIVQNDIIITAGGTTMWEICACKRAMYIYINEDFEAETAEEIRRLGMGVFDALKPPKVKVKKNIMNLMINKESRDELIRRMDLLDIAEGTERVVAALNDRDLI